MKGIWKASGVIGGALALLSALSVGSTAAAVANPMAAVATCAADGSYDITWTLTNTVGQPLTIGSLGPVGSIYSFPEDGPTPNPVPAGAQSITDTIDTPGDSSGTAMFQMGWTWMDGDTLVSGSSTGSVELDGTCVAATTTTTSPPSSTSTTSATSSTTEPVAPTTTGAPGATSTSAAPSTAVPTTSAAPAVSVAPQAVTATPTFTG